MNDEKTVSAAINHRRSVRIFDKDKPIDTNKVKRCLQQAVLAPNSSNMQLYQFYHVTSSSAKVKLAAYCLDQNAAKTAKELVVVVVRKDLWPERAKANLKFLNEVYGEKPVSEQSSREKFARNYYKKIIPFTYADFLGRDASHVTISSKTL